MLLSIGIIGILSPKTANFPYFLAFFANYHLFTWIFCCQNLYFLKAWPMYNKVKANIELNCHVCAVNDFYRHWATKHAL